MTDALDWDIREEITILGPVGVWPLQYRVLVRDVTRYDGPSRFTVSLQKKKRGHWFTVNGPRNGEDVTLYDDGQDRGEACNDRTTPSEGEQERLDELREVFGF